MANADLYDYALTSAVSRAVREVYKSKCQYCLCDGADHVDHIFARSKGGRDNLANYILACSSCNVRKGNGGIADQYLALITAIADRNKDRILRRIKHPPGVKLNTVVRIGFNKHLCFRIPISSPPTVFDVRVLEFYNNLVGKVKAQMDAKKQEHSTVQA